jgi:hypothetical protein
MLTFFMLTYTPADIIIFTHDYTVPWPDGPSNNPNVTRHWRTSGDKYLPCQDADGKLWMVKYDLDRPNGRVIDKRGAEPTPPPSPPPAARHTTRATLSKGKGKAKAKADDNDDPEEEEFFTRGCGI